MRKIAIMLALAASVTATNANAQTSKDVLVLRRVVSQPPAEAAPEPEPPKPAEERSCNKVVNSAVTTANRVLVENLLDNVSSDEALKWCEMYKGPDGVGVCFIFPQWTSFKKKAVFMVFNPAPVYSSPFTAGTSYECQQN